MCSLPPPEKPCSAGGTNSRAGRSALLQHPPWALTPSPSHRQPSAFPCLTSGHENTRSRTCSAAFDAPDRVLRRAIAACAHRLHLSHTDARRRRATPYLLDRNRFSTPTATAIIARPLLRVCVAANFAVAHHPRYLPVVGNSARRADCDTHARSDPWPSAHSIQEFWSTLRYLRLCICRPLATGPPFSELDPAEPRLRSASRRTSNLGQPFSYTRFDSASVHFGRITNLL